MACAHDDLSLRRLLLLLLLELGGGKGGLLFGADLFVAVELGPVVDLLAQDLFEIDTVGLVLELLDATLVRLGLVVLLERARVDKVARAGHAVVLAETGQLFVERFDAGANADRFELGRVNLVVHLVERFRHVVQLHGGECGSDFGSHR